MLHHFTKAAGEEAAAGEEEAAAGEEEAPVGEKEAAAWKVLNIPCPVWWLIRVRSYLTAYGGRHCLGLAGSPLRAE